MGIGRGLVSKKRKSEPKRWDGSIEGLALLGNGVSGAVFAIDENRVAKIDIGSPRSMKDIKTECMAYYNFSKGHPNVLLCLEIGNPNGLVFERCRDTVRSRLRSAYRGAPPRVEVVKRWAYQAAKGLAFVHSCGVIQGDVGCHNMLLDSTDSVKLADFAGSSVDGSVATVGYEIRSRLPGADEPNEMTDIFALGSAMYEMATGKRPYEDKSAREVQNLYKRGRFPKLSEIPDLGRVIENCWQQLYGSAREVVDDLDNINSRQPQPSRLEEKPTKLSPDREAPSTYFHHGSTRRQKPRRYDPETRRCDPDTDRGKICGYSSPMVLKSL